jgi:hypothetical protein
MMAFKPPGLLRGLSPQQSYDDYLAGWMWGHVEKIIHSPHVSGIRIGQYFHPLIFARMIAKIAHGTAVLAYGLTGFSPCLTDIIRGTDLSKLWWLIGGDPSRPVSETKKHFDVRLLTKEPETNPDPDYIMAEIRLFGNLGAPIYWAIVGENLKKRTPLQSYRGPNRK